MPQSRFESILETVGRTPVVRITKLAPPHVRLYAKLESFNPMGSVKDRLALASSRTPSAVVTLQPGQTVVEATSGNTGIGLAMVCARKGYPLVVTMAENFSIERRKLMRFLGAKVVLTPAALKGSGMVGKATELAATHGWYLCRQFENEANADIHSRTTAPEILAAFEGQRLDYWVTGCGTGGTLKGVARVLRERVRTPTSSWASRTTRRCSAAALRSRAPIRWQSTGSHPLRPHLMQGWTPDFHPKLTQDAVAQGFIDRIVPVNGTRALALSRELARQEGMLVGTSGGATLAGALTVCAEAPPGSTVLCMLPDTGERYLSTPLFAEIPADMDADELAISRSTPNYRFDVASPPPPAPAAAATAAPAASPEAEEFVTRVIGDAAQPVVMFALRVVRVLLGGAQDVRP